MAKYLRYSVPKFFGDVTPENASMRTPTAALAPNGIHYRVGMVVFRFVVDPVRDRACVVEVHLVFGHALELDGLVQACVGE